MFTPKSCVCILTMRTVLAYIILSSDNCVFVLVIIILLAAAKLFKSYLRSASHGNYVHRLL